MKMTLFLWDSQPLNNVLVLESMLRWFELASELIANFYKSKFGTFGIDGEKTRNFTLLLNCGLLKFSFNYLGIPIGAHPKKEETWDGVVQKVKKRLAS